MARRSSTGPAPEQQLAECAQGNSGRLNLLTALRIAGTFTGIIHVGIGTSTFDMSAVNTKQDGRLHTVGTLAGAVLLHVIPRKGDVERIVRAQTCRVGRVAFNLHTNSYTRRSRDTHRQTHAS